MYVYRSQGERLYCVACSEDGEDFVCDSRPEMAAHLLGHRSTGWLVPQKAIDDLFGGVDR